jgi:hypothetical protein
VRYGAGGQYVYKAVSQGVACDNSVFGDPAKGLQKACSTAPVPPADWVKCADENGVCSLGGTYTVAYGANGSFRYKTATGAVACNNTTFTDPLTGALKACYYR